MGTLYTVLSFIIAIGILVVVHEFGHFWVARRLGVKVLRFSVGFGRPLWRLVTSVCQTLETCGLLGLVSRSRPDINMICGTWEFLKQILKWRAFFA